MNYKDCSDAVNSVKESNYLIGIVEEEKRIKRELSDALAYIKTLQTKLKVTEEKYAALCSSIKIGQSTFKPKELKSSCCNYRVLKSHQEDGAALYWCYNCEKVCDASEDN